MSARAVAGAGGKQAEAAIYQGPRRARAIIAQQRCLRRRSYALTFALLVALMVLYPASQVGAVQEAFLLPPSAHADPKELTSSLTPSQELKPSDDGPQLHGRFLHITDLHPDPNYKYGSAVVSGCHKNKPKKSKKKGKWRAGWWGTGNSGCDSPPRLVSATLDWISHNWIHSKHHSPRSSPESQGLDFIIWTGDSARHDIDNSVPRSAKEIFELNKWALSEIERNFPGVPIVPNLGNNDIFPHNIMFPGPNAVTKSFASIWSSYIPEFQIHTFLQGAYFSAEVVPDEMAVISLNTLYFYNSNKAIDGCVRTKKGRDKDPGTAQLEWLLVQLQDFRSRSMQVHIIGHVGPTSSQYFPRCYRAYSDLVLRFQDTIVGQHFGHSNYDAFYIQEDRKLARRQRGGRLDLEASIKSAEGSDVHISADLPATLRDSYSSLPGRKRTDDDAYQIFYVAPSVVPTTWPSVRVWTYNTTRKARYMPKLEGPRDTQWWDIDSMADGELLDIDEDSDLLDDEETDQWRDEGDEIDEEADRESIQAAEATLKRKKHGKKKKNKKKRRPRPPRHASPLSPSRTNTYLTPLGYSQWILDMDAANSRYDQLQIQNDQGTAEGRSAVAPSKTVRFQLEYATYSSDVLWCEFGNYSKTEAVQTAHQPHIPVPKHLLVSELHRHGALATLGEGSLLRSVLDDEEEVSADFSALFFPQTARLPKSLRRLSNYAAPTMTIPDVLHLARRLAVDEKLWKTFTARIWSSSLEKQ